MSRYELWLIAVMNPPSAGMCSIPCQSRLNRTTSGGFSDDRRQAVPEADSAAGHSDTFLYCRATCPAARGRTSVAPGPWSVENTVRLGSGPGLRRSKGSRHNGARCAWTESSPRTPTRRTVVPGGPAEAPVRAKSRLAGAADGILRPRLALAFAQDTVAAALAVRRGRRCGGRHGRSGWPGGELAALGARIVPDSPGAGLNAALAHGAEVGTGAAPGRGRRGAQRRSARPAPRGIDPGTGSRFGISPGISGGCGRNRHDFPLGGTGHGIASRFRRPVPPSASGVGGRGNPARRRGIGTAGRGHGRGSGGRAGPGSGPADR